MPRLFTWGAFVELSFSSLCVPKLLGWDTGSVTLSLLSEMLPQGLYSSFLLSYLHLIVFNLIVWHLGSINAHTMDNCNNFHPKSLKQCSSFKAVKARQAFLQHTPGLFPGNLFPLAKGNPRVFSTGWATSQGFQQAHREEFPKYCDKTHKQTDIQAKRRLGASRLRYNEAQRVFHMGTSTGWSTLLCCSPHPRDTVSPGEDSHYCVLFLTLCSQFGFGSVPWDVQCQTEICFMLWLGSSCALTLNSHCFSRDPFSSHKGDKR